MGKYIFFIIDTFNLDVEKQVIQTLFFTITKNKKDDGEFY